MTAEGGAPPPLSLGRRLRQAARPIAIAYVFRTVGALAIAGGPVLGVSSLLRHVPFGDRDIMNDGGLVLLEALWRSTPKLAIWSRTALISGLVVAVIGLVPLAFINVALAENQGRIAAIVSKGARLFPTYLVFLVVALVGQAILFVAGVQLASSISPPLDTPSHAVIGAVITMVAMLPLLGVSLLHDVARVVAAARGVRFYDAASKALSVARRRTFAVVSARIVAALASAGLAALGVVTPLAIGLASPSHLFASTLVEQVVVALLVVVRAAYFARLFEVERTT